MSAGQRAVVLPVVVGIPWHSANIRHPFTQSLTHIRASLIPVATQMHLQGQAVCLWRVREHGKGREGEGEGTMDMNM
eukprot:12482296-Alexandrium_andersonii.AAC.1